MNKFTEKVKVEKFFTEPYEKLNKIARERGYYPNSPHSGMCWFMEEVLGIDPNFVGVEGFNIMDTTYETFLCDMAGNVRRFDNGEIAKIHVAWTDQQRKLIREWWDYIPPRFKGEE